jgi:hypothetical protein
LLPPANNENNKSANSTIPLSIDGVNCRDRWLELRLAFVCELHKRFGDDRVSFHFILNLAQAYGRFRTSCDTSHRFEAWRVVVAASQWLAQLEERG